MLFDDLYDEVHGDSRIKLNLTKEQLDAELDEYWLHDPRRQ